MKNLIILSAFLLLAFCSPGLAQEAVQLFNGKDLTGWTGADYEVKDGVLICKGKILRTEKQFSNYVLELDFLLPPRGNNGLGIHYPGEGRPSGTGMELQILDNSHPKYQNLKDSQYPVQASGSQAGLPQAGWPMEPSEGHHRWPQRPRGIKWKCHPEGKPG